MSSTTLGKYIIFLAAIILCYPFIGHFVPIVIPFLFGLLLALAAEAPGKWLHEKGKIKRPIANAIAVTAVLLLTATLLTLLSSLLFRQLGQLSKLLPDMTSAIDQGTSLLQQWLLSLAEQTPGSIRPVAVNMVHSLFNGSAGLLQQALNKLTQIVGSIFERLSHILIAVVTAGLSSFLICMRLPQLRQWLQKKTSPRFYTAGKEFRSALGHWLWAQGKLAGIAFVLLWLGFLLLNVQQPLLWAFLVTLVDILPILGVGTILLPWSAVCFLQGNTPRAVGLLGIFLCIWLIRSVLEPKLVGKELGLDPLVTLICIYAGFRLWGIIGMLLAPIAAVCVMQLWRQQGSSGDLVSSDESP